MANTIEYAKIFNAELDSAATQGLMTGWMEANAGRVKYNGGNEVKIPKMTLDGLGDYKRDTGYPAGTINLAYETMKMTQDRGKKFTIDAMDVDESNFAVTAASVLGEFQSTKVLPEIDAYRIATLFGAAKASSNVTASYTPSKEDAAIKLKADITKARKLGAKNPVVHISFDALAAVETQLAGMLRSDTWNHNGIGFDSRVPMFDGCPLIATEDARMYTKVTINPTNGYSGTGNINWIVADATTPIAVSKTDIPRIFAPDVNQDADAWVVTYRKYHDLWIKDNAKRAVVACISGADE